MSLEEMIAAWEAADPLPPEDAERFGRKMQDQALTNHSLDKTLAEAGLDSIFDLPLKGDDEGIDGPALPRRYRDYVLTLRDALDKLPDYRVTELRRGATLTPDEMARYVPGTVVTEHTFTSASIGAGLGGNVRFIIHGLHGKHIEGLSAYPSEREVLFTAGSRFYVHTVAPHGSMAYIHLEEVDDA